MKSMLLLFLLLPSLLLKAHSLNGNALHPAGDIQVADLQLALAGSTGKTLTWKELMAQPEVTAGANGYLVARFSLSWKPAGVNELIGPYMVQGNRLTEQVLTALKAKPLPAGSRIFLDEIAVVRPDGATEAVTGGRAFEIAK